VNALIAKPGILLVSGPAVSRLQVAAALVVGAKRELFHGAMFIDRTLSIPDPLPSEDGTLAGRDLLLVTGPTREGTAGPAGLVILGIGTGSRADVETTIRCAEGGAHVILVGIQFGVALALASLLAHFPTEERPNVAGRLSRVLRGVVTQKTLLTLDGPHPELFEAVVVDSHVRSLIANSEFSDLREYMALMPKSEVAQLDDNLTALVRMQHISPGALCSEAANHEEFCRLHGVAPHSPEGTNASRGNLYIRRLVREQVPRMEKTLGRIPTHEELHARLSALCTQWARTRLLETEMRLSKEEQEPLIRAELNKVGCTTALADLPGILRGETWLGEGDPHYTKRRAPTAVPRGGTGETTLPANLADYFAQRPKE
jgi:hypothetical protein